MIRNFVMFFLLVASSGFSMNLQQAREFFAKDQYENLLTVEMPRDTGVANFCKVFSEKMREDRIMQGKADFHIPDWATAKVDDDIAASFASIATKKGEDLLKQWKPERARLWLHFGTRLGSPTLSCEEECYIESMITELRTCEYANNSSDDELLKGLDEIADFDEGNENPLPTNPIPLRISN